MIVAIVGRPNVGKSTLFNRLIESRQAITSDIAGTTRDRNYGTCIWNGHEFSIIDTGGFDNKDDFASYINSQIYIAIQESDVILFLVDSHDGIMPSDLQISNILREQKKHVILVANKTDNDKYRINSYEFSQLGFGNPMCISSNTGSGTGDLLDEITKKMNNNETDNTKTNVPRIAIIGRPNVGKSSLVNALLSDNRNIVSDIAGTTRDSIDSIYNKYGKYFILTDTAGIHRKSKVKDAIEFYSVMRSIKAIENSDVCVLLIDATQGILAQDMTLISLINKRKKGILLLVNKWDLIDKNPDTVKKYKIEIEYKLKGLKYVPVMYISALTKANIFHALEKSLLIYQNRQKHISTNELNKVLLPIVQKTPPTSLRGKMIKIKYITQLPMLSVVFAFFCNHPEFIRNDYYRFLENNIRKHFDFEGVPITITFKQS